jgi:hypothetical protein
VDSTVQSVDLLKMAQETDRKAILDLKQENDVLRKDLEQCQRKLANLDNYSRHPNLIFEGVPEVEDESNESLLGKIQDVFNKMLVPNHKSIRLERYHRLGIKYGKRPRPIIVRFNFYPDRMSVWSHRTNLKGENVFVKEDYCTETLKNQAELIPILKAAKKAGKKGTLIGDTLLLEGKRFTCANLGKLPTELRPENVTSKKDDNALAFFGRQNPGSNFHPCSFTIDGIDYSTVEQYYQYHKAKLFNDKNTADEILASSDPSRIKYLARHIRDYCEETWEPYAKECMHNGVLAKFGQNKHLLDYLLTTGNDTLYEASPKDLYWGIGLALSAKSVLDPSAHRGLNNLGEILMTVRNQLVSSH